MSYTNEEEHLEHLRKNLERVPTFGIEVNPSKCMFEVKETDYLGYLIDQNETRPIPARVQVIKSFERVAKIPENPIFSSEISVEIAAVLAPLNSLTKSYQKKL